MFIFVFMAFVFLPFWLLSSCLSAILSIACPAFLSVCFLSVNCLSVCWLSFWFLSVSCLSACVSVVFLLFVFMSAFFFMMFFCLLSFCLLSFCPLSFCLLSFFMLSFSLLSLFESHRPLTLSIHFKRYFPECQFLLFLFKFSKGQCSNVCKKYLFLLKYALIEQFCLLNFFDVSNLLIRQLAFSNHFPNWSCWHKTRPLRPFFMHHSLG